jgi:DNA-binding CsgD family transcriptional regulator
VLSHPDPARDGELRPSEPLAALTAREAEVLELASRGLTNRQIAARLHVTVHAVKFHLAGVYRKLGVANRTEAVVRSLLAAREAPPLHAAEGSGG